MSLMLQFCVNKCIEFIHRLISDDFIVAGVQRLLDVNSLFGQPLSPYIHCSLNPPYKKIRSDSIHRKKLRQINIEISNWYSTFVAVAIKMLASSGQFVCYIPHTVIGASSYDFRHLKIFSFQDLFLSRSKMTRCPFSAPQRSIYSQVCLSPLSMVVSRAP